MTTRLRIALDYRPAILGRSGVPRSVRELTRSLREQNDVECRLFGHSFAWARVRTCDARGLHRLPIPGRSLPALARLGLTTDRLVGGADVVHWTDFVLPPVSDRVPVVWTAHDLAFFEDRTYHGNGTTTLIERSRQAAKKASQIVTPSGLVAEQAAEHLKIPRERITTIPWGIDHGGAWPEPTIGRGDHLVCLGTIEPRKHHRALLRAFRRIPDRPKLIVIGRRGWESDRAAADLLDAERDDAVVWIQDASDEQVAALLRDAAGLVYLSSYEGFGFPPLEALARGLPVLVGSAESCHELGGTEILTCDPADEGSIQGGLIALLDQTLQTDSGRAGRIDRAKQFRWHDTARRYAAIYLRAYEEAVA